MNCHVWNVRGLNHPSKQQEVRRMIKAHKIGLICLIETRVKVHKADKIRDCIVPGWGYEFNYDQHILGRIWVCWKKANFAVNVLDKSAQSINCVINSLKSNLCWYHSFIYGDNHGVERRLLWVNLASMRARVANNPWMIGGDFNVVKSVAEKWGSDKLNSYEIEFGQCLNDLEVLDLNFSGCYYTWTNKSEEPHFVARKLDRVLANEFWLSYFGKTIVEFCPCGISDHSSAVISIGKMQSFGPKPFKFFNYWVEHKDFLSWVKEGWDFQVDGFPMYQLYSKLKVVKIVLKRQNLVCFGNLQRRVMEARDNLDLAQKKVIESCGSAACMSKERECLHAYVSITNAEEAFLKQKARNQWLKLGDQNSSFFHRSLRVQNARNSITLLWDENGNRVEDVEQIKQVAVKFYEKLLGSNHTQFTAEKADRIRSLIPTAIPSSKLAMLEMEVSTEEIRDIFFHMPLNKAPGPDGFSAEFFREAWSVVGEGVVAAIKGFFLLLVCCLKK
jgi:hypothetical protein